MSKLSAFFINPMLNKEIKLRFRSFKSFLGLFFYLAVLGAAALGFIYIETGFGMDFFRAEDSRILFIVLSMGQLGLILFMTPGLTAGIISSEREKQTLNILLTTEQSSLSIILSKLISSLAFLILMVFASLPLYSIVFLYGGVSPKLVFITFGIYLVTMLAVGSLGIMLSTLLRKTMTATITTYGITAVVVLGIVFLFVLFQEIMFGYFPGQQAPKETSLPYLLMMFNPPAVLISILEPGFEQEFLRNSSIKLPLTTGFVVTYLSLTVITLAVSIKKLRPSMKKGRKKA
jgi:ABC-2 type transport system permease protein